VVGSRIVPVNKILSGYGKISGERVFITISSIEQDGTIIPISLSAYDKNGQQGIHVPGSMEVNAVKEITGNMGGSLGSSINISQQSAGDQLLSDLGRSTIQGTSQYIAAKAKEVKVTLKAGHPLLLLISEQ
ncbi:MAG: conjugative transposon protein TraM, partial [Tannerellaceae bacterium]|nr:conjugative transposon protein TraM [Tannerellaceae bacterium]